MQQPACFDGFENLVNTDIKSKLQNKYIVPPFSILDTKQGYWQDRKRIWAELGIQGELGRGIAISPENTINTNQSTREAIAYGSQDKLTAFMKNKPKYGMAENNNSLLDAKTQKALGCYASANGAIIDRNTGITGTSIFDPVLCELMYKWFCPANGTIFDSFAGGSVRGIVANYMGYKYTGIDLSTAQVTANIEQGKTIVPDNQPVWINGNSSDLDKLLPEETYYDFLFSCPPYHNLEQYTDDMDDLSNMSWNSFKIAYKAIIHKAIMRLKDNRFGCFVISEIRDEKGYYKGFVPYTIECFETGGMRFYNELILVNTIGTLPVRIANYFNYRKIGRMHQNILVFYKGDTEYIPKYFNAIEIDIKDYNI